MIQVNTKKCIYCGGCTAVCPQNALTLMETCIECDPKKCVNCGTCERFCPVGAITTLKGGKK